MALRVVELQWSGSVFDLIARLHVPNTWNAPAAARNKDTGLWIPGFTFVFAGGGMQWFALTTPKPYSAIRPFVID